VRPDLGAIVDGHGSSLPPPAVSRGRNRLGHNGQMPGLEPGLAARLKRDADGLIAAVAQQHDTGEVLMLGWMDDEALHRTLTTGRATYWSRSRKQHWVKGETSGNRQWVREVRLDCDGDTVLVKVDQEGPACHTGSHTCFDDGLLVEAAS
jgi:phosphoribosyl-AMP cyclohydrolase